MNSAPVRDPDLIRRAAERFGAERVTVAIDAQQNGAMPSGYEVVVSGGTKPVGKDVVAWAKECEALGAGAILPTSIDTDGVQEGYDLALTRAIADAVDLPVIASGGAGTLEHFYEGAVQGGAQILLAASVFHFRTLRIREVKEYLRSKGLEVRL
jgi:imidazole glycerol-phosphate synthase subunit HisF